MSLLRQRAIDVRADETLRALSPAAARLRFVRAMRSFSEPDENALASQAKVGAGFAIVATEVTAKSSATRPARRRSERCGRWRRTIEAGDCVMRFVAPGGGRRGWPRGFWCGPHRRQPVRTGLRREGPGRPGPGYRRVRWRPSRCCGEWCGPGLGV